MEDIYEQSEIAWKNLNKLMRKIDSDYWVRTGQHLSHDEAFNLAVAYFLFNKEKAQEVLDEKI